MNWAWRLGQVRGIEIKVHVTFVFALIWGALVWGRGDPLGWLYGALLTAVLFGIVLLHELGHSLAAQHYGIKVHDIVLLPIGGVARLSRMPEKPQQELAVALAGPVVNLALALLLAPVVVAGLAVRALDGGALALPALTTPGWLNFATFLLVVNVSLLLFNLVPAFPLDGGRVLRSLLALRLPYVRATVAAATLGRLLAIGFGVVGVLTGNLSLALIAVFVFFGAGAESQEAVYRETMRGLTATAVVDNQAPVLPASSPAHVAFERLARSPYPALAVLDEAGQFLGVVTRAGMQRRWADGVRGPVGLFAEQPLLAIECATPLEDARRRMAEAQVPIAAVYCGNTFEGLLDLESIGRVLALRRHGGWWERDGSPAVGQV